MSKLRGVVLLHLDELLVAVDKPAGLLSLPSKQASDRVTCMSLVRDHLGHRVYPVHRLDRGTSGVLLFGRTPEAASRVAPAFREHRVRKAYLALVRGWTPEAGEVDYPVEGARPGVKVEAVTRYRRLAAVEVEHPVGRYATARYSLVEAEPVTGRRHQIRRHFKHLRHPLLGDPNYGDTHHNRYFRERFGLARLMLHARALELEHPDSGDLLRVESPVPDDLGRILADLGFLYPA